MQIPNNFLVLVKFGAAWKIGDYKYSMKHLGIMYKLYVLYMKEMLSGKLHIYMSIHTYVLTGET